MKYDYKYLGETKLGILWAVYESHEDGTRRAVALCYVEHDAYLICTMLQDHYDAAYADHDASAE
jgi:hypothetical protein